MCSLTFDVAALHLTTALLALMQGVQSLFHRVCVWVCLVGDWHDRAESVIQKSYLQILDTNPLSWTLILIPIPRSWSPLQTFRDLCISWFTAFQVPLSDWSDNKTIECHGGSGQNKPYQTNQWILDLVCFNVLTASWYIPWTSCLSRLW